MANLQGETKQRNGPVCGQIVVSTKKWTWGPCCSARFFKQSTWKDTLVKEFSRARANMEESICVAPANVARPKKYAFSPVEHFPFKVIWWRQDLSMKTFSDYTMVDSALFLKKPGCTFGVKKGFWFHGFICCSTMSFLLAALFQHQSQVFTAQQPDRIQSFSR